VATVSTVIDRTVRQLLSGTVEERNKLAASISATATTVSVQYDMKGIREGVVIQVDAELMYVWEITVGNKSAVVERGWNGTTAVAHATNSIVVVDPKFPRNQIVEAINAELDDLSSPMNGLFQVKTMDIDYNGSWTMLNIPTTDTIIDLISVSSRYLTTEYQQIRRVRLIRDLPNDDFNSGYALKFDEDVSTSRIHIVYKTPFTNVSTESQNIQNMTGLPSSCEDILIIGAQIRLVNPREVKRNFTESQGDTRRAEEVTAGAVSGSITNLMRMRRDRITSEAAKLQRQYPTILSRI
jgi:hypothetical protein